MSDIEIQNIYIDLDAILDTRLGTLSKYDQELAIRVLMSGNYHNRKEDVFEDISKEEFRELYSKRDKEILATSALTNISKVLKELISDIIKQSIATPYQSGVKVTINVFPYKLDDIEKEEISIAMEAIASGVAIIEIINVSPEELTPAYCKQSFSVMIKYDYEDWMNIQTKAFETKRLSDIVLFAPGIFFGQIPTENEIENFAKDAFHPLRAIEILASGIIGMRLLDVEFFSIYSK